MRPTSTVAAWSRTRYALYPFGAAFDPANSSLFFQDIRKFLDGIYVSEKTTVDKVEA